MSRLVVLMVVLAGLSGCSGSLVRLRDTESGKRYVAALVVAQNRLAVAERAIPASPSTPVALAASIRQLGRAIDRLRADLAAIRPPGAARAQHHRLIAIVTGYRQRLAHGAGEAARPGGLAAAETELISATSTASTGFVATVQQIDKELVK